MINPIEAIKQKLDIIEVVSGYIKLQKAGRNYRANCPFHAEKTPSFFVSPERQSWRCFGCNLGGSIFDFVMQIEGLEFGDALRILAKRAGVELIKIDPQLKTQRTRLYEICELAASFYEKQLAASQNGQKVQAYLNDRGLSPKTVQAWRLGYAPDKWQGLTDFLISRGYQLNEIIQAGLAIEHEQDQLGDRAHDRFRQRIIFPIFDLSGLVIGFTGRIFGSGEPKYLNISNSLLYDKSAVLYGLDKAKLAIRQQDSCIIVEGQMDVIAAHQAGFINTVAASGTALTDKHLAIIKRYSENVLLSFDMDQAGEQATKRSLELAIQGGLNAKIIVLPDGLDPAECFKQDLATWTKAMENAQFGLNCYFNNTLAKYPANEVQGKKTIGKILLPIINKIPNKIEQAHWLGQLSALIRVDDKILAEELKKINAQEQTTAASVYAKDRSETMNPSLSHEPIISQTAHYALGMLLSYPDQIDQYKDEPLHLFEQPELALIFKKIKKHNIAKMGLTKFQSKLPSALSGVVDQILFLVESNQKDAIEPREELIFCFNQLKKKYLKQKLQEINLAIKTVEQSTANQEKSKENLKLLTEKFNKFSQQLTEL